MRFGVQHGVGDPRWTPAILHPDEVRRWVTTAEHLGFDAVAFTDHPAPSARWVDSGGEGIADLFASLAFCAAVTSTVRLLSWVLVPPYRNPFVTAHQVATVDHLSQGRVTLGLGTGYLKAEFHALGMDPSVRVASFEESVDVMCRVWAGEDVDHEASAFSARGVRSVPAALQRPHPPLWVHGNTDWGMDYAARHAEGWIGMVVSDPQVRTIRTRPIPDLDALERRIEDLAVVCARAGRDLADLEIISCGTWPMLDVRAGRDTAQMRDEVARMEAMGVSWMVFNVCGDDPNASVETLEWFSSEVMGR